MEEEKKRLEEILAVASNEIVYHPISENLVTIKTKFQELRRKYNLENDLSWLAIEIIEDEPTRVIKLFQDAWAKDLLEILGETLCIKLKKIYDMFGTLLPFSPTVSAAGLKAVANTFQQNPPNEDFDSTIQKLIEEGTLLLEKFPFHHMKPNGFELDDLSKNKLIRFQNEAFSTIYQLCQRIKDGIDGGQKIEDLSLVWIKIKRILFFTSTFVFQPIDVFLSPADDRKDSIEKLCEIFSTQYNMKAGFRGELKEILEIEYSLIESESAFVLLSESYFENESTILELLILRVRAIHNCNLSHYAAGAVLNSLTEEPDINFKLVIARDYGHVELLNSWINFRELISTYQKHDNKSEATSFDDETISKIGRSLKSNVEKWVFAIFSKVSKSNDFQTDEVLGTLEIHRDLKDGKMSVTIGRINAIQGILEPTWLNKTFSMEFNEDDGTIRIGAYSFERAIHGKTKGSLKIGNKDYDCYAARFSFDPKPEWLKNCLISKFPNLREITNFLDYKSFATAPYRCLICVSGSQNISDREILKKLFNEFALCSEQDIIFCGSRTYETHNIVHAFYRILDWGVMVWFEETPKKSNKMARFDTFKPNSVTFLQLRTLEDKYWFSPINITVQNGLAMTTDEYSNVKQACEDYIYFPSNVDDATDALDALCNNFQSQYSAVGLDAYFQKLLNALTKSNKLDPKIKILGFDLCYNQLPRPSIIPIHPIVLSYAVLSFLQPKMVQEAPKELQDTSGTITATSKATLGDTLQNPSTIIDAAQQLNAQVLLPAKEGSTILKINGTRALCNELDLMHFISTIDDVPFRPLGFAVDEISWNPTTEGGSLVSEVIKSKIERANQANESTISHMATATDELNSYSGVALNISRPGIIFRWIITNLSILDSWESFGYSTPLRGESFIPLKFTPRNSKTANSGSSDVSESKTICMLLNQLQVIADEEIPHAALILGHAGQGKTTLLRRLSFILPSQSFSTLLKERNSCIIDTLNKLPQNFIRSFINSLKTELEDYDFTGKTIRDVVDWIKEQNDEDLLLENSAVFCIILCKEIYQLILSFNDFDEVWNCIKKDPLYRTYISAEMVELLDNLGNQPEYVICEQDRWNIPISFLEFFAKSKLDNFWDIALLVRSDQLWQSLKIWESYEPKSRQFIKLLLQYHIDNMNINDEKRQFKVSESDAMFDGMLKLLVANETKIVLMVDAVDEVSIGERSTNEFNDFMQKILKMCRGSSRKIHKMIITGRYSCLQPIPERLDTVEIISLTKPQSEQYIQSLLRRWPQKKTDDNFPSRVTDLRNKLNIEGSPLILLLLTRLCYLKSDNSLDGLTYYGVYEELIVALYDRCVKEKPSLLELVKGLNIDRKWVLDIFSLFGYITHLVGSQQGVTVIRKCDIAFLFEQFRAEGYMFPESDIDLQTVMKSSLPNDKWVKEDSCTDEYLVTWCMFHHRTFQEFLAARILSRFEEIQSSGSSSYPALNNISIIENFNWAADNFVCSDWWDLVRKFIVSKHGIEYLANKIMPYNTSVKKWAYNIINNNGVDNDDLGHVRLGILLSCIPYSISNDVLESLLGQVLVSVGNSNAKAMCSILEDCVGILKDSGGYCKMDQNSNTEYLTNICQRIFNGLEYGKFTKKILISEISNTYAAKSIKFMFGQEKDTEKQKESHTTALEDLNNSSPIVVTDTPKNSQSIITSNPNDLFGVGMKNDKTSSVLSGKSSKDLCDLLADKNSTLEIFKSIWELENFKPSVEELSINVFQQFPISEALNILSSCRRAVYLFYRYMKLGDSDNCGKQLNKKESIKTFQEIFEKYRKVWPVEFIGKMVDWNVVLNGNWYPWIENLLESSSKARNQCGKVVRTLPTDRLLFCQPYFRHLSKVWRRFIKNTGDLVDADPLCRHDEVKYVAPPIDKENDPDETYTKSDSGLEPDADPIFEMCRRGRLVEINEWLATAKVLDIKTRNGETPLHIASENGNAAVVQLLIDRGASIHENDKDIDTPLHMASLKGHEEVAQLLIAKGANIMLQNKDVDTPLHYASVEGHRKVAQLLIDQKANVHEKNKDGDTPLHYASLRGHKEVAQLLIDKRAKIDEKDNDGDTPLHIALERKHKEVAQLLIEKGANINGENDNGDTPLRIALRKGYTEITRLLIKSGAIIVFKFDPSNGYPDNSEGVAEFNDWKAEWFDAQGRVGIPEAFRDIKILITHSKTNLQVEGSVKTPGRTWGVNSLHLNPYVLVRDKETTVTWIWNDGNHSPVKLKIAGNYYPKADQIKEELEQSIQGAEY